MRAWQLKGLGMIFCFLMLVTATIYLTFEQLQQGLLSWVVIGIMLAIFVATVLCLTCGMAKVEVFE